MSKDKFYDVRDAMALDIAGGYYCRHVSAMTAEGLHSKSDIAAELGWRDMQIAEIQRKVEALAVEGAGMDKFVDAMLHIAWHGGSADGFDIQDAAIANGLIRAEVYSYEKHENMAEDPGNFEDGDDFYVRVETPATDAALAGVRAQGVINFVPSDKFLTELIRASNRGDSPEEYRSAMREVFASQLCKESGQ